MIFFFFEESLTSSDVQIDHLIKGWTVGLLIICHKNKRFRFPGGNVLYFCSKGIFTYQFST